MLTVAAAAFFAVFEEVALGTKSRIVIEKAYWNAGNYDPVVQLSYTIDEPVLQDRVAIAVSGLERVRVSGTRRG